jgi:hypothetical protein
MIVSGAVRNTTTDPSAALIDRQDLGLIADRKCDSAQVSRREELAALVLRQHLDGTV